MKKRIIAIGLLAALTISIGAMAGCGSSGSESSSASGPSSSEAIIGTRDAVDNLEDYITLLSESLSSDDITPVETKNKTFKIDPIELAARILYLSNTSGEKDDDYALLFVTDENGKGIELYFLCGAKATIVPTEDGTAVKRVETAKPQGDGASVITYATAVALGGFKTLDNFNFGEDLDEAIAKDDTGYFTYELNNIKITLSYLYGKPFEATIACTKE